MFIFKAVISVFYTLDMAALFMLHIKFNLRKSTIKIYLEIILFFMHIYYKEYWQVKG